MSCASLRPAIDDLLLLDGDFARQQQAALSLHDMLSRLSGFDSEAAENRGETVLTSGLALSPLDAASCVTDYPRSAKYVGGLIAAVRAAQLRFPGERIEIVYAGCGPFAFLTLPLTLDFTPAQVGFTLLDFHPQSLVLARTLYDGLGISDYVTEWAACDATSYQLSRGRRYHVLVSETMRKVLASEPQVEITLNLLPQLEAGGILVPERIVIDAYAVDQDDAALQLTEDLRPFPTHGRHADAHAIGRVFELSAATAPPVDGRFPAVTVEMPAGPPRYLMLTTRIYTFGDILLDDYESGLTYPKVLRPLARLPEGSRVELQYVLGKEPEFRYRLL